MKIAVSNLAWDKSEDEQVLELLKKYGVTGIEIAPTKVWESPTTVNESEIEKYRQFWNSGGIEIVATTSLLFGHPELTIFENEEAREKTFAYLTEMVRVSSLLGAKAMVFGSPKNRQRFGKNDQETEAIALDFFRRVGEAAKEYGVFFGIEPNPTFYGTDFMNTTGDVIEFVKKLNHPHLRLHMDSGAMKMNEENCEEAIKEGLPLACHFHISEPQLKPVPAGEVDHKKVAAILQGLNYNKWVSVEMPLALGIEHLQQIDKTLKFVTKTYGS